MPKAIDARAQRWRSFRCYICIYPGGWWLRLSARLCNSMSDYGRRVGAF